jgi:uncharacterized protein
MPEVVSNTSPIQYLHQIGVLAILPALYSRVMVPRAVADEIGAGRAAGVNLPDPARLPEFPSGGPGDLVAIGP